MALYRRSISAANTKYQVSSLLNIGRKLLNLESLYLTVTSEQVEIFQWSLSFIYLLIFLFWSQNLQKWMVSSIPNLTFVQHCAIWAQPWQILVFEDLHATNVNAHNTAAV